MKILEFIELVAIIHLEYYSNHVKIQNVVILIIINPISTSDYSPKVAEFGVQALFFFHGDHRLLLWIEKLERKTFFIITLTGGICAISAFLFWLLLPETKGKTLSELCQTFVKEKYVKGWNIKICWFSDVDTVSSGHCPLFHSKRASCTSGKYEQLAAANQEQEAPAGASPGAAS